MNGSSGHPWYHWLIDISLGVIGAIFATLTGLGVRGMRDILRDLETSKLKIEILEERIDRLEKR